MCGIAGIVHADPSRHLDPNALHRMNDAMRHRGPDDGYACFFGSAGIAARRLSIRDLDHGRQPMTNEDGSHCVAFNGELYNDAELRAELEAKGCTFRTTCDTETVLRAVEAWGDDAVLRFNGMFAFAAYDRARRRLLLVRDRLGIKPLFYAESNGALVFASELDALMQSNLVDPTISPAAIDAYLTFLYIPAPDTIYERVHKLRPGEMLVYERGYLTRHTYWSPQRNVDEAWTLDSAAECFRELLTDSVKRQRVADVPLGAFLSGGIDSSTVVTTLAQIANTPKTFSIGFDDAAANELPYARAVAQRFSTDHTEEIVRPELIELAPQIARHFGEPFADSSVIPTWCVAQLARRDVTVALSGDGGDELFAGYTWLHMNRLVRKVRALPQPARQLARAALRALPSSPNLTRALSAVDDTFLDGRASFLRRSTCFTESERARLHNTDTRECNDAHAINRFYEHADAARDWPEDDWMLYQDLRMVLPDDILTKVDRMSMAHGLEVRVPMLDHRIVEFAFTLPFRLKLHRGESKRVVKHAFRNDLPPACLAQRKRGFAIPIDAWFRNDLASVFQETVLAPNAHAHAWLDSGEAHRLFAAHQSGAANNGHRLWALLILEHWLHQQTNAQFTEAPLCSAAF